MFRMRFVSRSVGRAKFFNKTTSFLNRSPPHRFFSTQEPSLQGTKTHENLKAAFAGESQANRRYLFFAQKADIEGLTDVARVFRDTGKKTSCFSICTGRIHVLLFLAEGETAHANGHLFFLEEVTEDQFFASYLYYIGSIN